MERRICANASCRTTSAPQWRKGWPLRSGEFVDLCDRCGSAYENSNFCETFHSEQSGWRECEFCEKRIHCGCIAARPFIELMDFGGVRCASCPKNSQVHLSTATEIKGEEEEKSVHLYKFMDTDELNLLRQPPNDEPLASSREISEGLKHSVGEVGVAISNLSSTSSCILTKEECSRLPEKLKDVHKDLPNTSLDISLGTPAERSNFILPISSGTREGNEQKTCPSPFQGPNSHPILPTIQLSGNTGPAASRLVLPQVRVARPPAEGRGKSQLLPRYWPRITDQELQQLSGDLNSTVVPLFEKVLSASDAGRIGRLVLPKACAEAYFPPISQSEGVPVRIQDVKGNEWTFQFRFWPNNNSRMYVLEGVTPCIQSMQLRAGDTVTFSRINPSGKLVMGFRKASNSMDHQENGAPAVSSGTANREASFSSIMGNVSGRGYSDILSTLNGIKDPHLNSPFENINDAEGEFNWHRTKDIVGRMSEDAINQPQISEKKKTRNIGSKSRRLLMHCEDVMELRLTWEEAQDLLRPPPSVMPTIVTIDGHDFEEYDEPPVFGKRTIHITRPSGSQEQWVQCDDCTKWRKLPMDVLIPPKWTCSDNAWDSERRFCSAPDEINAKELEGFLRVTKDCRKRRVVENQAGGLNRETSGLDALASAAVLGENIAETSAAGPTTKHPRHRAGCTCIVCIQPPSGKGKHKSTCTCNVCMTVKRRFKTLMLRKKKRQSEAEAEAESAAAAAAAAMQSCDREAVPFPESLYPNPIAENSNGTIDLNCDPYREEPELEAKSSDITNMNLIQLSGMFTSLRDFHDEQAGGRISQSGVVPQANGGCLESSVREESENVDNEDGGCGGGGEGGGADDKDNDNEACDEQLAPQDKISDPPPSDKMDQSS